jgi:uncharacterized membrane protein YeiB
VAYAGLALFLMLAAASAWSMRDATRRPERWGRLFDERRALRATGWVLGVAVGAAIGAALSGGEELAGAFLGFGLVIALVPARVWLAARGNRARDDFLR